MPYKFLRGDTVRHISDPAEWIVAKVNEDGTQYLLHEPSAEDPSSPWTPEEDLEIVKRASDDETGFHFFYIS